MAEATCSEDNCEGPVLARGLCNRHYQLDWRRRNPGRHTAYNRASARRKPQDAIDRARRWRQANPERHAANHRASESARRARIASLFVERVVLRLVWERDEGVCHCCGMPADPRDWHLDHVIPLALDGPHCYDNVAVSHPTCNQLKGTELVESSPRFEMALAAFRAFHALAYVSDHG